MSSNCAFIKVSKQPVLIWKYLDEHTEHMVLYLLHYLAIGIKISKYLKHTPLYYSCLENPMGGGAWWAAVHGVAVHGVAKSRTRLSEFTFTFHVHALKKEMAARSSVLAWRIPGRGSLVGSHGVRHDWSDLAAAQHLLGSRMMSKLIAFQTLIQILLLWKCVSCSVMSDSLQPHGL